MHLCTYCTYVHAYTLCVIYTIRVCVCELAVSTAVVDNGYNPDNPGMTLTGPGGLGLLPQGLPGTNVVHAHLCHACTYICL